MSQHLPIEETDLFRKFEDIASVIWDLVSAWKPFPQDTIGKQLVRAADSIGANLVEGDGRYTIPDSLHFFVIARGSARETQLWIWRAVSRKLIATSLGAELLEKLDHAIRSLNSLITFRRNKASGVRETQAGYDGQFDPDLTEPSDVFQNPTPPTPNTSASAPNPEHQTPNTSGPVSPNPEHQTPNTS